MSILKNIEPVLVWKYFEEICKIPRPSKNEGKIVEYICEFARKHQLGYQVDELQNILITKPSTKGNESKKSVVLQSHLDMVGEKNEDKEHDFTKDSIEPFIDGDWIKARGATLGADDGIGIAAQLAILASDDIPHGELECLFTVDEETG